MSKERGNPRVSRRQLLASAATVAPVMALAGNAALATPSGTPPAPHPAASDYQPRFFTPTEWAFILAACARLIPADALGPGAVEAGVPQYIDQQMATPWADGGIWYMEAPFQAGKPEFGYQSALTPKQQYRAGIKAIDDVCQAAHHKTFAQLPPNLQDEFLKGIEAGTVKSDALPLGTFFSQFLLKNTREGFFGDPLYGGNKGMVGWKLIGHPGARADFLEFVGEAKPYPYGPVSLYGKDS